ncbi:MAG TPA: GlsB/YeaQ/YmgE family stress response membrane protein [Bryobacteraceae bacterium]|nr:GlsB/YeaQ/YmgE family stress response membrane protein [Bryobacteraceae bacterium]
MLHILWITSLGVIVGVLAKLFFPGRDPGGVVATMLLGAAGSFVGALFGRLLGLYGANQVAGSIVSILGAVLLLALYRLILADRQYPTLGLRP